MVHLRGCHPGRIRHALADLPETLNETYERTLQEINKADWELAHRLFQCVAVASRPLRVEELAEFLAFDFKAEPIPTFHKGWRPEDPVDAVVSTCPSFLSVVNVGDSQIILFSHFSVKEFLTSARLTEAKHEIARYHVSMTPAQTLAARACLGILLLDENVTQDGSQKSPLARYAALHWVDHARFQDVSRTVKDGINNLFDPRRPHLASWVSLHNAELLFWKLIKRRERPLPPNGTPLYYATVCGLHAFVKALVVEHQHDVDSRCFDNLTPLHIASLSGHEEVVRVLLDCDADVACEDEDRRTPLHLASKEGHLQVVRILLERGAPTTARDKDGSRPLHLALQARHEETPHVLDDGAEAKDEDVDKPTPVDASFQIDILSYMFSQGAAHDIFQREIDNIRQDEDGSNPYITLRHRHVGAICFPPERKVDVAAEAKGRWNHSESSNEHNGHVEITRLLVEHGSDATAKDKKGLTPLHLVSLNGHVEVARFLGECGADVAARDKNGWTPLYSASQNGHVDIARFLVDHGSDAKAQAKDGLTPLHSASRNGHMDVVRYLVEHGANATAQKKDGGTPLHSASYNGHVEVARFLVEHGADVTTKKKDGWTPLHFASQNGYLDIVQFLFEHGADATAPDKDGWTPLHSASLTGHIDVVRYLVGHGADATAETKNGWTPLHSASFNGHVEVAQFLVKHGADVRASKSDGWTPLHLASLNGHVEVSRFLVEHGANVTARERFRWTPLHVASITRHVEVARLLIKHGADVMARQMNGMTPLHLATYTGRIEVVRFLVARRAPAAASDNFGWSPRDWATLKGHVEVMRALNVESRIARLLVLPFLFMLFSSTTKNRAMHEWLFLLLGFDIHM